jgi:hypothetical protein
MTGGNQVEPDPAEVAARFLAAADHAYCLVSDGVTDQRHRGCEIPTIEAEAAPAQKPLAQWSEHGGEWALRARRCGRAQRGATAGDPRGHAAGDRSAALGPRRPLRDFVAAAPHCALSRYSKEHMRARGMRCADEWVSNGE